MLDYISFTGHDVSIVNRPQSHHESIYPLISPSLECFITKYKKNITLSLYFQQGHGYLIIVIVIPEITMCDGSFVDYNMGAINQSWGLFTVTKEITQNYLILNDSS